MKPTNLLVCVLSGFLIPEGAFAQENAELAKNAKAILEKYCHECHGKNGANEGGFNYVLDRARLVERGKVVPGILKTSKLFKRLTSEDDPMPPDNLKKRPTAEEIAAIKEWIGKGATDFNPVVTERAFISNEDVFKSIAADLEKARERDRHHYRYFTLTHLYNAGLSDDELQSYRNGLSKLINSLSWNRDVTIPKPIDDAKTVLRIDLTDYDWNEKTWDRIVALNPYSVTFASSHAVQCYERTKTKLPLVRGDWFVSAASRPPLYHDILELPKSDLELEKRLEVRVSERIQQEKVIRAGFNNSGVSRNNRLIERHKSSYGAYWKSYDFAKNDGKQNLFEHPLGPNFGSGGAVFHLGGFIHDGGEIIFNLPNGLQAYFLINGKGERIDKGPTNIVADKEAVKKGLDPDVVNGIGCMRCHSQGMREKADEIRPHILKNTDAFGKTEAEAILALYPDKEKLASVLKEDGERFRKAVNRSLGKVEDMKLPETEPIDALAVQFEQTMNLKLVAAELGLTASALEKVLGISPRLVRTFGPLRVEGGALQRSVFAAAFSDTVNSLALGTFISSGKADIVIGDRKVGDRKGGDEVEVEIAKDVKMKFCWIPPGEATLGDPKPTIYRDNKEHEFTTKGFWMGKYTVTQEEWQALMGDNPSYFKPTQEKIKEAGINDTSRFPVENVSWNDCQDFLKKLTNKVILPASIGNGKFALPHENDWEYACRGGLGNKQNYYFGDELALDMANCRDETPHNGIYNRYAHERALRRTTQVGSYEKKRLGQRPHPWGLCDMHGNVFQWCENNLSKDDNRRVIRGGCWGSLAEACESSYRSSQLPDVHKNYISLRVAVLP